MSRNQIGVAWNSNYGGDQRPFIRGSFDLGVKGEIPFAAFLNKYHDPDRRTPTHNFVVTVASEDDPNEKERIQVGAGWVRTGREPGREFISFTLELNKLGAKALPGVDFSADAAPLYGRLVVNPGAGTRGPHYLLFKSEPVNRADEFGADGDGEVDLDRANDVPDRAAASEGGW